MEEPLPKRNGSAEGKPFLEATLRSSKTISCHPIASHPVAQGLHSKNYSYLSESAWESHESSSGYYHEKQTDADEGIRHGFYQRLYRFYEKYNPKKLDRIEEYLTAYKGEEEQLFAILKGKYGPEPPDTASQPMNSACSSENASIMHYVGKRYSFPTVVSPQEGNTDCETPYWGNFNLIGERDVLGLLCNLDTTNEELQKCYIGILAHHPNSAWNGMTYITRAKGVASSGNPFLGHIWAGNLSSRKAMVHEATVYYRVDLYCTDECQRSGQHERWRLSMYSSEVISLNLFRVVWDPVISFEPLPVTRSAVSVHSSEQVSLMGSSASHPRSRIVGLEQPQQPPVGATLASIVATLERLENKLCTRLDALEAKLSFLELKLSAGNDATSNNNNS
ncbi:hypothetical protein TcG_01087 [Trypanosoma cruzi]|nr:hypothetical protein TcG_01087 [Trypanosoma cruzi]